MSNFQAVLFDCDGVLVDSEPLTNRVLRDMLIEAGWHIGEQQCADLFIGHTLRDRRELIEAHTGQPFTEEWLQTFYQRRNAVLREELQIIPGAWQAVQAARQHTLDAVACASGADRFKVEMQLQQVGLWSAFEGRVFSGHEMPRSKPFPDVYLAAMAHLQVPAHQCLVIEDTATGAAAGLAAGATVWGYCPFGDARAFQGVTLHKVFGHMGQLAELLGQQTAAQQRPPSP